MTTFHLSCPFPTDAVHVFLFAEVLNAIELRSKLLAGDPEYLYAFINADLIVSQLQLLAAVNRAVHDVHYGLMRTKHLHSEIVYALAGTQNIMEALKTFGVTENTKNMLVVKVSSDDVNSIHQRLLKIVEGQEIPFTDSTLAPFAEMTRVLKHYKLLANNSKSRAQVEQSRWENRAECAKVIVGIIALRGSL